MAKKTVVQDNRVTVRLDTQAYRRLEAEASRRYVQLKDLVKLAIGEFLQRLDASKEK